MKNSGIKNNQIIDSVLEILSKKLFGVDYAFIGSVGFYIQGIDIAPKDIDILTIEGEMEKKRLR